MAQRILITGGKGYIGSRLRRTLGDAACVDIELFGDPDGLPCIRCPYQRLRPCDIEQYDVIIHLAAYPSPTMCVHDPEGAVRNNLTGFADLLRHCRGKRLIYASSASVYNGCRGDMPPEEWAGFVPANRYDATKYASDLLALTSDCEFYGLRFGTVCGWSPNLRSDLVVNKMAHDARETGLITVTNPCSFRAVLDLGDLCRAVEAIICSEARPGIYNLASFNLTIHDVANRIAGIRSAKVRVVDGQPGYDFSMSCDKFRRAYGFTFEGTLESVIDGLDANPPALSSTRNPPFPHLTPSSFERTNRHETAPELPVLRYLDAAPVPGPRKPASRQLVS
jgi:UDP-glucose 4-epimerase